MKTSAPFAPPLLLPGLACATPTPKHPSGRTGTLAGNQAHRAVPEAQCAQCREAARAKSEAFNQSPEGKAYRRKYYVANKQAHAARNLMAKSAMTEADYDTLLAAQHGKCAICRGTDPAGRWKSAGRFHVDHDHDCCPGKTSCGRCVRGLLCGRCNVGLGAFLDDAESLIAAAAYLMTARGETL